MDANQLEAFLEGDGDIDLMCQCKVCGLIRLVKETDPEAADELLDQILATFGIT